MVVPFVLILGDEWVSEDYMRWWSGIKGKQKEILVSIHDLVSAVKKPL